MEIAYQIRYLENVAYNNLLALFLNTKKHIKEAIKKLLMVDHRDLGKPLRYSLKGHRRLRVGDYRTIYRIEPNIKIVVIVAIKHRKDAYEDV